VKFPANKNTKKQEIPNAKATGIPKNISSKKIAMVTADMSHRLDLEARMTSSLLYLHKKTSNVKYHHETTYAEWNIIQKQRVSDIRA
jgi:hypothetical protein